LLAFVQIAFCRFHPINEYNDDNLLLAGVPLHEQPGETERLRKKTHVPSNLSLMELEDYIVPLFPRIPQLARVGFTLCKATKMRQLVPVVGTSVAELRREIKRGQLYVLPKRDLTSVVRTVKKLLQ